MPEAADEIISVIENNISGISSVTDMLKKGQAPEDMVREVLAGLDVAITDTHSASFRCDCSRERVLRSILSIGKKDLQEIVDDGEPIEVNCSFCGTSYTFSPDEIAERMEA